jgi:hypothetical protein
MPPEAVVAALLELHLLAIRGTESGSHVQQKRDIKVD